MGAHFECAYTNKQREIMRLVLAGADAGELITVKELQAKLSYGPHVKKQAILCSLRGLKRWGYITFKYRGPKSAQVAPTAKAYPVFRFIPGT